MTQFDKILCKHGIAALMLTTMGVAGSSPALANKEGYHFSEVHPHQFVEGWPSVNADGSINIKIKVSNGAQIQRFSPTVAVDFINAGGASVMRFIKTYSMGEAGFHGGTDRTYNYNIPNPSLWTMTSDIKIVATENPPPMPGAVSVYRLDDPLSCLGGCGK